MMSQMGTGEPLNGFLLLNGRLNRESKKLHGDLAGKKGLHRDVEARGDLVVYNRQQKIM